MKTALCLPTVPGLPCQKDNLPVLWGMVKPYHTVQELGKVPVPMGTAGGMDLAAQSLMRMGAGTPKVGQFQPTATINMSMIAGDANWRQHTRVFVKDHLCNCLLYTSDAADE